MEQSRQMYVKRELHRRRVEKRQIVIAKAKYYIAAIALVFGTEAIIFALLLM